MYGNLGPGQAVDPRWAQMQAQRRLQNGGFNRLPQNPNQMYGQAFEQAPQPQFDPNRLTPEQQAAMMMQMQQMGQMAAQNMMPNQMQGGNVDPGMAPGANQNIYVSPTEMPAESLQEQSEALNISPETQKAMQEADFTAMNLEGQQVELGVVENTVPEVAPEEVVSNLSTEVGFKETDKDGVEPETMKEIEETKKMDDLSEANTRKNKMVNAFIEQRYQRIFGGRN